MKDKAHYDLSLVFKIPRKTYKCGFGEKTLTPAQYAEFVEMGLKILPDIGKEREFRIKNAPKVPFKLY